MAGCWEREVGSWKPGEGSWEFEDRSRKTEDRRQKPEAGSLVGHVASYELRDVECDGIIGVSVLGVEVGS